MRKKTVTSIKILRTISILEKKHKVITYSSLLFLTVSTYFLRTDNQSLKISYASIKQKNSNLREDMIIFNRSYDKFPLAIWRKVKRGNKFIYQYVNDQYMKDYGAAYNYDPYSFVGKSNFDLHSKKMAQTFYESDLAVAIVGQEFEISETIKDKKGNLVQVQIVKWRDIVDKKDTLVYGLVAKKFYLPKVN